MRKYFVPRLYQFRRGISGGAALKYFYMIHRGGRTLRSFSLQSRSSSTYSKFSTEVCFLWGGGNVCVSWLDYISFRVRPETILNRDMNKTRPISWVTPRFQITLRWNHYPPVELLPLSGARQVPNPHPSRRAQREYASYERIKDFWWKTGHFAVGHVWGGALAKKDEGTWKPQIVWNPFGQK